MSHRCSICRHPKLDSINVSLVRDGTRFTAREFQISRPALNRHKRHLTTSLPIHVRKKPRWAPGQSDDCQAPSQKASHSQIRQMSPTVEVCT